LLSAQSNVRADCCRACGIEHKALRQKVLREDSSAGGENASCHFGNKPYTCRASTANLTSDLASQDGHIAVEAPTKDRREF
jgi:hypothetical protein